MQQEIANNAWIIGHLDLIKAKYRFMRDCKAVVPEVSSNRSIQLLQLRHPLIENAVANDLHFTEDLTEIVITGPNTGGKTIMLKTLGLAQIMAQSGLPILADPGSRVGIFSQVFADIGDEQSIEQSLSTFSSHMTNIVSILHQVDTASLILLDELGAGTDPQEGAGLAIAILEDLRLRGIKTPHWRQPTIQSSRHMELRLQGCKMPVWNLTQQVCVLPIASCKEFLVAPMPLKLPAVWAYLRPLSRMP